MEISYIKRSYKEITLWKNVTADEWNDWTWQISNRITNLEKLKQVINLTDEEQEGVKECMKKLRMAITPYYACLMDADDYNCPIRRQAVPTISETVISKYDRKDPLHEEKDSPVPGLVYRYPDRALLLITDQCSVYCRHCTRRRFSGQNNNQRPMEHIKKAIEYIRQNKDIRDVVISGGDALCVSDEVLRGIFKELRAIKHVEIIRIGTRTPVVMPQRITKDLCNIIKEFHPIWINTHFNHPKEITDESKRACEMLADSGVPIGNQSVLLKDINDCPYIMKKLVQELVKIRVRPYYLYQCDLSEGIEHFRTSVDTGIEIIETLRGHTSGLAVPTYVIDAPGGGGKIPISPEYLISRSPDKVVLRNFEGNIYSYPHPDDSKFQCRNCELCQKSENKESIGIEKLFREKATSLEVRNVDKSSGTYYD